MIYTAILKAVNITKNAKPAVMSAIQTDRHAEIRILRIIVPNAEIIKKWKLPSINNGLKFRMRIKIKFCEDEAEFIKSGKITAVFTNHTGYLDQQCLNNFCNKVIVEG